ncbi:DNA alkylation repair protein [Candidatus Shapirobacteria bacterium]|nr:DNA alkylation repair protein [Candidatus Shapirobacteria bacterium]
MDIQSFYRQVQTELFKLPGKENPSERSWVQKYLGSNKPTRCIKTDLIRQLAKKTAKANPLNINELVELIDKLYSEASTFEETSFAASLIGFYPKIISQIPLNKFDYWLTFTHGWAEVDSLCSSDVSAEIMLENFPNWSKFLKKLSTSKNINQRRASIVFLCKPLRQSSNLKLANLSLELVEKLKFETDILITKAVSWILRSMVKNFPSIVREYLETQGLTLPRLALRETRRKIETGKK